MTKTVVLPAISGAQQSAMAQAFSEAGWTVRGTSRQLRHTAFGAALPADLETGEGLEIAFEGAEVAVLTLLQDHRSGAMERIAGTVAAIAARTGVGRLVLNAAGTIDEEAQAPLFQEMRAARQAVRECGRPFVVLQPTVFMDNLLAPWSLHAIVNDAMLAYPAPAGAPISWLSHRSLADFVLAAASAPDASGRTYRIGGPAALTGDELAAALSASLGKEINYVRVPLDGFAAGLNAQLGTPAGDRIASLYALLERQPQAMATGEEAAEELGVQPEDFARFAARQNWSV